MNAVRKPLPDYVSGELEMSVSARHAFDEALAADLANEMPDKRGAEPSAVHVSAAGSALVPRNRRTAPRDFTWSRSS